MGKEDKELKIEYCKGKLLTSSRYAFYFGDFSQICDGSYEK